MLNHFPFYYSGDDDYVSPRQYDLLRRQEELRRRRALEMRENKRRLAYERELRRRLEEEEEYKQQLAEEERLRQLRAKELQMNKKSKKKVDYRVVPGWDGLLYRVPVVVEDDDADIFSESKVNAKRNKNDCKTKNGPRVRWHSSLETTDEEVSSESDDESYTTAPEPPRQVNPSVLKPSTKSRQSKSDTKNGRNCRRQRVTVVVEDASDSEYEDDDLRSPWRNRRPAPGQWLEPVDTVFDRE